jgi:hypothetical protein
MQIAVVDAAQRHIGFVSDLAPNCARLPKLDVMNIGRAPAADKAVIALIVGGGEVGSCDPRTLPLAGSIR